MSDTNNFFHYDIMQRIAGEAYKVKDFFRLRHAGYPIAFAPDFSEIYSYMSPLRDIWGVINESDEAFSNKMRYWYAAKLLLEKTKQLKLFLPPYLVELRSFILALKKQTEIISASVKEGKYAKEIIDTLLKHPGFKEALFEFQQVSDSEKAKKLLAITKDYQKELGVFLEVSAGAWSDSLHRLDKLWESKTLISSDSVISIDSNRVKKDCLKWVEKIEYIRPEKRTASYMDGWAVEYIIQANKKALEVSQNEQPFIFFVSRSFDVQEAIGKELIFSFPQLDIDVNFFWSPDTFLAYYIIQQVPTKGEGYMELIKAADELQEVGNLLEKESQVEHPLLKNNQAGEIAQISKELWEGIDNLTQEIENVSLYDSVNYHSLSHHRGSRNRDIESSLAWEYVKVAKLLNTFLSDKNNFVSLYENELNELWREVEKIDEKITAFEGAKQLGGVPIKFRAGRINGKLYASVRVPLHSFWISFDKLESLEVIDHLAEVSKNCPEELYLEVLREIGGLKIYYYEVNLLVALLHTCLGNYDEADQQLEAIDDDDLEEIWLEVELLRMSLDYLRASEFDQAIQRGNALIKSYGNEPRVLKILGLLKWRYWSKDKSQQRLLLDAIKYTETAINSVDEESYFKLHCMNNLAYFLVEQYDYVKKEDDISELVNSLEQLEAVSNRVYTEKNDKSNNPILQHTLGALKSRVAWVKKNSDQMEDAIKNLQQAVNLLEREQLDDLNPLEKFEADLTDAERKRGLLKEASI